MRSKNKLQARIGKLFRWYFSIFFVVVGLIALLLGGWQYAVILAAIGVAICPLFKFPV